MADRKRRPAGSPLLPVVVAVVLVPTLVIGNRAGVGGASIVGAFTAIFALVASAGGPLRADLRLFAVLGPLIGFAAVAPRLMAEASRPGAIAMITAFILLAGLLPVFGARFSLVGLGVGMGTLFGYGLALSGSPDDTQLISAAGIGVGVALGLRLLLGIADPSGPTRNRIADVLDAPAPDLGTALSTWLSDRSTRWLGEVLFAAARYRLALTALPNAMHETSDQERAAVQGVLDSAEKRAATLAASVRERRPVLAPAMPSHAVSPLPSQPVLTHAADEMQIALDDVQRALARRDSSLVTVPRGLRSRLKLAAATVVLHRRSLQMRHALRTALAVLLALLISLRLPTGDPLLPTLLMTTFAIMQVSWRETFTGVRNRVVGVLGGGVMVVVTLLVVPRAWFLTVAFAALGVGLWYLFARPALSAGAMVLMSVGLNTSTRHLDPVATLVEYVVLTAIALLIGSVIGFAAVPALRPPPLRERLDEAVNAAARALRGLSRQSAVDAAGTIHLVRLAEAATQQLVPDGELLSDDQTAALDRLRRRLGDLLHAGAFLTVRPLGADDQQHALARAAQLLEKDTTPRPRPSDTMAGGVLMLLAGDVLRQRAELRL